jgi:hypothetical protein
MKWGDDKTRRRMASKGSYALFGNGSSYTRSINNMFNRLFESIGEIDNRIHVSGDVYVATVTSDDHTPFLLFDKSEGIGLFNHKKFLENSEHFWFILSCPFAKMNFFTGGKCDYCGETERLVKTFKAGSDNPLCLPYNKTDTGELEKDKFAYNSTDMCDNCMASLLGIICNCEEEIRHKIISATL